MKGLSEKDEVAICPTVHVAGNFDGKPVKITLSHCAELSAAALEGNATVFIYAKPDTTSEGTNCHCFTLLRHFTCVLA